MFVRTYLSLSWTGPQLVSLLATAPCVAPFVCARDVTGLLGTSWRRPRFVGRRESAATSPTCLFSTLLLNRASTCCIAGVPGLSSSWCSEHKTFFLASFRKLCLIVVATCLLTYLLYLLMYSTYLLYLLTCFIYLRTLLIYFTLLTCFIYLLTFFIYLCTLLIYFTYLLTYMLYLLTYFTYLLYLLTCFIYLCTLLIYLLILLTSFIYLCTLLTYLLYLLMYFTYLLYLLTYFTYFLYLLMYFTYLLYLLTNITYFLYLLMYVTYLLYLLTYLPTPCSRVLLEKLTGLQLVKKLPAFYGTRRFITIFTSARQLSLSWASSFHSIPPHPTYWRSILILSSHLRLGLPSVMYILTLLSWERSFHRSGRFVSNVWITYFCTSYLWTLTYKLLCSLPNT